MAKAVVRAEMDVQDLQLIDEALRLLRHVAIYISRSAPDPLENFVLNCKPGDGNPRKLAMRAEGLRRELGVLT